jgi:acetolactate synthase-1/2/3 large subunit
MESVASTIVGALKDGAIGAIFGVPGGQTLPLYAEAARMGLPHVLMRDERNAACAADAYARLSGRVGFCDATVGPGATNLVSGLAEALGASVPMIALVADIRRERSHLRRRSVTSQAVEQDEMLRAVSKWVARIETPDAVAEVLDQALRVATTGRPGPVVMTIPEDVFASDLADGAPRRHFGPEAFVYPRFRSAPDPVALGDAVELLARARRPLILAGGGVTFSDASAAVSELAIAHNIPVATSISGKGTIDEGHPLAAGVTGSFGTMRANAAFQAADVVLVIGCKLTHVTTHGWQLPRTDQVVIHADIDGEEIGRTGTTQVGIVADARMTAIALKSALEGRRARAENWLLELADVPATGAGMEASDGAVPPHRVAQLLSDALQPGDVMVCDASLSSGWAAAFSRVRTPRSFIAPRGLAGIGWGGGAMIGARVAAPPDRRVVMLTGDGAWGFCLAEFETAARLNLDITCVVLNNKSLGWIAHVQTRRDQPLSTYSDIDFAQVAQAMGGSGTRATTTDEFQEALGKALVTPGPSLIDVQSSSTASPVLALGAVPSSGDAYA